MNKGKVIPFQSVVDDIREIIQQGRNTAYQAVSAAQVLMNWNIGKRIVQQEQNGADRAEYGKQLMDVLSGQLMEEFGESFSKRNLQYYRKFFLLFPNPEIVNTRVHNLSWSHFRCLLRVSDESARLWYLNEAVDENWSVRTLDRNISTQYYDRLLMSPQKESVITEMKNKTNAFQQNKYELIKSPIIAEFLGFKAEDAYLESELESAILTHIRDFLMELGRGFAFVKKGGRTMGLFKPSAARELKKDLSVERKTKYTGTNLQPIGKIPSGVVVTLSLDPDRDALSIEYKGNAITLPYERITGFTVGLTSTDKTNKVLKGAQNFLGNTEVRPTGFDPLGAKKLFSGLVGNVASNLIPQKKEICAISVLSYNDKNGEPQQLQFSNTMETDYGINNEEQYKDFQAEEFAKIIHAMKSRYADSITEL
ncbi:MAG: DUF1016 family protein [Clostridia bacterium]|nr:DUF1016 family protein [Clostridia bacterium]